MRGALDRRVFVAVSRIRSYCTGRGRGRAAPLSSPLPSPAVPPPKLPTTGLGHGTAPKGSGAGRGRGTGVTVSRPIGETSTSSPAAPPPPSPVVKGKGRGESPVVPAARNVEVASVTKTAEKPPAAATSPKAKPPAKSKKDVVAKKTSTPTGVVSAGGAVEHNVGATSASPAPALGEHVAEEQVCQQVSQTPPTQVQPSAPQAPPPQADERSEIFTSLINCCLARGLIHEIDYVYGAMRLAHVPMALQTCRALIDSYMRLGNLQKMDLMYMEMKQTQTGQRQPEPSSLEKTQASQTLAAMINSWYSRGFFQEVDLAYRGLKLCHLPVPSQVYGAVMDAYSRLGNQGAMDMVYGEMRAAMAAAQPAQAAQPPLASQPFPGAAPAYGHFPGAQHQYGAGQTGYYPPPVQMYQPPVYQTGYAPPQFQPLQPWAQPPSPYYAHPYVQPAQMPNVVPQGYPGYQPAMQYQPMVPHAPQLRPQMQPAPVARPPIHQTPPTLPPNVSQAKPLDSSHAPRPKLELQPKALELLQQSEYSKLLSQAQDRAALHRPPVSMETVQGQVQIQHPRSLPQYTAVTSTDAFHPQAQVHQPHPYSVPQYTIQPPFQQHPVPPPQYPYTTPAAPAVSVSPTVRPQAPPPSGYPGQPAAPPRPAVVPKPVQPVSVPKAASPPADKQATTAAKTEKIHKTAAQVTSAAKAADTEAVATKVVDVKLSAAKVETAERKISPAKAPASKPEAPIAKTVTPGAVKETLAEKQTEEVKSSVSVKIEAPSAKAVKPETGLKLKLGLKDKKQAAEGTEGDASTATADKAPKPTLKLESKDGEEKTEAVTQPEESPVKVSSLKLSIPGRGKGASVVEDKVSPLPKSPSLRLDLKKQQESKKQAEADVKATDSEDDTSDTETVPALPSLRQKTARGRGKGLLTVDPVASILGVHTPIDALLQQDGLDSEPDQETPSLPFESRRGKGRGKPLPVVDLSAVAAEQKRLKLMREEQAARAIAILESGFGKSQMSVYLERRKKRLSDQQFSLGLTDASRRRGEGRTGVTRKAKDSKHKAIQGEIDVDGAIEYIAPQEYMSMGDALTDVEEAIKGALHRHFLLDLDPEAAMEEFGTNPDIDDKPLPTLEQTLEKAKEKLMAEDGIDEKEWEEAVSDVKKRAPQLESLVQRYTGPKKQNAKQNNKELHEIVSKLPPFAPPELAAFTKRAMRTLQNNPDWSQKNKSRLLRRLVWDTQRVTEAKTS